MTVLKVLLKTDVYGEPVYLSVELVLPALHAHLPCTMLLNSEECALSEKKKKKPVSIRHVNLLHQKTTADDD